MAKMSKENDSLLVLIIGAGIGGLTAAIALRRQGHQVTIYERSKFLNEVGAGIHLSPNSARMLELLGMSVMDLESVPLRGMKRFTPLEEDQDYIETDETVGAPTVLFHRHTIHEALRKHAISSEGPGIPVKIHLESQLVDLNIKKPSLTLSTGDEVMADVIVCADGVNSWARSFVAPRYEAKSYGMTCFRWLGPYEEMKSNAKTGQYASPGLMHEWRGYNRKLVSYPLTNHELLYYAAFVPNGRAGVASPDWKQAGNKNDLLKAFKRFGPGVQQILARAPDRKLMCWDLQDMEELPTWISGNVALIGDAAHPLLPFIGQGAAMAIEDGISLSAFLPRGTNKVDIPERLCMYQQCCKSHVREAQEASRRYGWELDSGPGMKTYKQLMDIKKFFESHNEWERSLRYFKAQHSMSKI